MEDGFETAEYGALSMNETGNIWGNGYTFTDWISLPQSMTDFSYSHISSGFSELRSLLLTVWKIIASKKSPLAVMCGSAGSN
jgi:hypothetical protein